MARNIAIKVARAQKDMTQTALAEAVGISRQTMNAIEQGQYNPTIRLCRAICRVLDKSLDELFGGDVDMKEAPEYDEKQRLDRDTACRYGFFTALGVIILNYFITGVLELSVFSADFQFLFCLFIPVFVWSFTAIAKNAYDGINGGPGRIASFVYGATGLFLTISSIVRMTGSNYIWFDGSTVDNCVIRLPLGLCLIVLCLFYWIVQKKNKKEFPD